ncbi:MAG: hypothetical protein C5S40_00270 [ANME-2 cluster archaeon]|nr:hypothetical protein [ANME-2 cluster archaeon]
MGYCMATTAGMFSFTRMLARSVYASLFDTLPETQALSTTSLTPRSARRSAMLRLSTILAFASSVSRHR